jgi:hypothetical protein
MLGHLINPNVDMRTYGHVYQVHVNMCGHVDQTGVEPCVYYR